MAGLGKEYHLCRQYHQKNGGRMYTEVPVPWSKAHGDWPAGYHPLSIDAIRLLSPEYDDKVTQFMRNRGQLLERVEGSIIEVIEVKPSLNRSVIGQAIIGSEMVAKDYRPSEIQRVVVCEKVNPALEPYCQNHDIRIEVCEVETE